MRLLLFATLASLSATTVRALPVGEVAVQPGFETKFVLSQHPVVVGRIDPIIAPGSVSAHVHTIFGASNIRSVLNHPDEQDRATCTTADTYTDKSNYWAPTMYYAHTDGTYEPMAGFSRTYYIAAKGDNTYTTPFPRGLRMITGTAMFRKLNDLRAVGVEHDCIRPTGGGYVQTGMYLPNSTSVPEGCSTVRANIYFPSCGWANQSLDSPDFFSHMTWPIESGGGHGWYAKQGTRCPASHPIKYPTIFLETIYRTTDRMQQSWGEGKLILANGDTLGDTFHADFISGWDEQVLEAAINTCVVGDKLANCPAFANTLVAPETIHQKCMYEGMQPDENVGFFKPITKLPGDNCPWGAESNVKPSCGSTPDPGWTLPNVLWVNRHHATSLLIPAELPIDQDMTEQGLTNTYRSQLAGKQPYLRPCSEDGNEGMEIFRNRANIRCGSNQDIHDNLNMSTAKNKQNSVPVMQDRTAWRGMTPSNVRGQSSWRIFPFAGIPNDQCWTRFASGTDTMCFSSADKIKAGYPQ